MDIISYAMGKKKGGVQPTGEIKITQNGITNVSGYATADVDVAPVLQKKSLTINSNTTTKIEPDSNYDGLEEVNITTDVQPDLESKSITITENKTTLVQPTEGKDGLSSVSITTNVAGDPSAYFNTTVSDSPSGSDSPGWNRIIKQIPDNITITGSTLYYFFQSCPCVPTFTFSGNVYALSYAFKSADSSNHKLVLPSLTFDGGFSGMNNMFASSQFTELDLSTLGSFNTALNMQYMFYFSMSLKKVNLSNLYCSNSNVNAMGMFNGCTHLEEIDMSSFDFSKISSNGSMFNSVPTNCLIYVKDQTQVDWFTTNFPSLTNVQIKGA